jgi:dTDP-L-rhamnose 4-epimerase
MKILVTGGAGFIGSHVVDLLVEHGHQVSIIDCLEPQVHGTVKPGWLNSQARYFWADIENDSFWLGDAENINAVVHLASLVSVSQSMVETGRYVRANCFKTAKFLDALAATSKSLRKIVVAGSMSGYGEGAYLCPNHGPCDRRKLVSARNAGAWDHRCPACSAPMSARGIKEDDFLIPVSIYGETKRHQEAICILFGHQHGISVSSLRYFNVYGPRQSLSNSYTGVISNFLRRAKCGENPIVYEDGLQTRDFIHVSDVSRLTVAEVESDGSKIVNVGTGTPMPILSVAKTICEMVGSSAMPEVTHRYRPGDIRHCFADTSRMSQLGNAKVKFEEGILTLI